MKIFMPMLGLAVCLLTNFSNAQENWPGFRGPQSQGVSEDENLPDTWSDTENVLWKRDVAGRGWSSPVVWGNQVFLTTVIAEGESELPKKGLYFGGNRLRPPESVHEWKVVCLDLQTGEVRWQQTVRKAAPTTARHLKNSFASETPVTDGKYLYAYFGNVGVFCFTMDGKEVWSKKLEPRKMRYGWGTAASPVLHKDRLYIVNDNHEESYLLAMDKETGKEIWRVKREEKSNWSTPFIWENKLRTEIITPGTDKHRAYDLDGKLLYEFVGASSITIATPYSKFDLLYLSSGYVNSKRKPMFAIRPGGSGDISLKSDETSNEFIAWSQQQAAPYNPTTLVYGELVYVLMDRGYFACYDAKTGKEIYGKRRLPNGRAFTSSPWAYNGKIFCLNEFGETYVVKAGKDFEIMQTNSLGKGEMCMATPAMAGDKLIIRTEKRVFCLKKGAELKQEKKPSAN